MTPLPGNPKRPNGVKIPTTPHPHWPLGGWDHFAQKGCSTHLVVRNLPRRGFITAPRDTDLELGITEIHLYRVKINESSYSGLAGYEARSSDPQHQFTKSLFTF